MKYEATFNVHAHYYVSFEGDSLENAKAMAQTLYDSEDFGKLEDIMGGLIKLEDENGNEYYFDF